MLESCGFYFLILSENEQNGMIFVNWLEITMFLTGLITISLSKLGCALFFRALGSSTECKLIKKNFVVKNFDGCAVGTNFVPVQPP